MHDRVNTYAPRVVLLGALLIILWRVAMLLNPAPVAHLSLTFPCWRVSPIKEQCRLSGRGFRPDEHIHLVYAVLIHHPTGADSHLGVRRSGATTRTGGLGRPILWFISRTDGSRYAVDVSVTGDLGDQATIHVTGA